MSASASLTILCTATPHNGVFGDGFQILMLPQTAAMQAFQANTATGKLNAVIVPTTPSGCHCSYMRCCGRSECIVLPYIMRDWPTAKSAMSIISCTSPSPSALILPISRATRLPSASLCSRSALPMRRTASPRTGAGILRHSMNASWPLRRSAHTPRCRLSARWRSARRSPGCTTRSVGAAVFAGLIAEPGACVDGLKAESIQNVFHVLMLPLVRAGCRFRRARRVLRRSCWCRHGRSTCQNDCRVCRLSLNLFLRDKALEALRCLTAPGRPRCRFLQLLSSGSRTRVGRQRPADTPC